MPFYRDLKPKENEDDKRTVERLLLLREQLNEIPARTLKDTLLLATWNIRDFDAPDYGERLDEAIYYMAEIIDRFDLIAIPTYRIKFFWEDCLVWCDGGD